MENKHKIFNIYYLNFSKVFEISMMINNVIVSSIQKEEFSSNEVIISSSSKLEVGSKQYLANLKAVIGNEDNEKNVTSSKMIESLDVKTTKSILLRSIIKECKDLKDNKLSLCKEGELVKLNNVKLNILDEENLRSILLLRREALEGVRVEGLNINKLLSSILHDYSYILSGKLEKENIMIKIPLEAENEFENKYNIDDLLIGHVSIIGIYKSTIEKDFITSNTFNYAMNMGKQTDKDLDLKIIVSNDIDENSEFNRCSDEEKYHFIDVISIIQEVSFVKESVELKWHKKILVKVKEWFKKIAFLDNKHE